MHWSVAASFINERYVETTPWLDDFVPGEQHSFTKIPRRDALSNLSWHKRSSRTTSLAEWQALWHQSREAWKTTNGGIITVFPQLAITTGLQQQLCNQNIPVVAWCFNIGQCYPGLKQQMSRFALQNINRFIVHSQAERKALSEWLNLPLERFEFVPLQRAAIPITEKEDTENPFILAMGSANRDYPTLFKAVEKLNIRTIVVAATHALSGLDIPPQVELYSGLTMPECHRLVQKARLNVVPLLDTATAAGQVTIVEAMRMNRPVIATRCTGSEDYIQQGKTGFLVEPGSVEDLTESLEKLWSDSALRDEFAQNAGQYAAQYFSDEAAGMALNRILDEVVNEVSCVSPMSATTV